MLSIAMIVLGATDVPRAAAFWSHALGYLTSEASPERVVLVPSDGEGTTLAIDRSTSPVVELPRVHLDLDASDAAHQRAEVERLLSIGAHRVDWGHYPVDPYFVVLADTEGNIFCVVDTSR